MSYNNQYDETVSVGEWIGSMLLMLIPVVNIVLMFVWAFGSAKPSKRNYFRASLLIAAIMLGLCIVGVLALFATGVLSRLIPSMGGYYY